MTQLLEQHLDVMKHEISDCDVEISSKGYKVDGTCGIKNIVELPNRKSVDYFFIQDSNCIFIEFTDIARQKEDQIIVEEDCVQKEVSEDSLKMLRKAFKLEMRDGIASKFKDSSVIFSKIPDFYDDIPDSFKNTEPKEFHIVYTPPRSVLTCEQKSQIAQYLPRLVAAISDCLEDAICSRVKLVKLADL